MSMKVMRRGYVGIPAKDHPYATANGYVLEHRLVMEQLIGRYLEPHEVVHHVDENKQNNDPSNLRLYSSESEHQRLGHGSGLELSKEELTDLYVSQKKSRAAIAQMFDVSVGTIGTLLKNHDIQRRGAGAQPIHDQVVTEPVLKRLYLDENRSTRQIAKILGVGSSTVEWYMKKYGIPGRKNWKRPPVSEESRQNYSAAAKKNCLKRQRDEKGQWA